jgi:diguanylate cyclase (GGDEF)-like protein
MKDIPIQAIIDRLKRLEDEFTAARVRIGQLEAQIETDPLLDVLNRRGFERELNRGLAHVKRYRSKAGLIFLDLNDFKMINDQHGHLAGDAILRAVAAAINMHSRKSDVVGRFGGDEFVLLLWNAPESNVRSKALALEKMIDGLEISFAGKALQVKASAGIAMLRAEDTSSTAIERADADMYSRKESRSAHLPRAAASKKSRASAALAEQAT